jgi:hypothetical protein
MPKNLIFLHLPKNGGTTFQTIVRRYYSRAETFWIGYNREKKWNLDEFINLPEEKRKKIHLLLGHFMFGLHKYLYGESDYITFLRKPIERTISFYNYVSRTPQNRLYEDVKDKSLFEFVTQIKDFDINNGQIRKLSGVHGTEEEMFDKALDNIEKHFSFVGLQERFDESLIILAGIYGWNNISYKKENVSRDGVSISELDDKTIQAIKELNHGDLKLYEIFEKRFDKSYSQTPYAGIKRATLTLTNLLYSLKGKAQD